MIVVPASLKAQWAREWARFTDLPVEIVDGNAAERAPSTASAGFLLVNYEQVLRDLPLMNRLAPDVVVLDEAQRIKNWAAKTSAYVKRLDAPWRLALTGTHGEPPRGARRRSSSSGLTDTGVEPRWRLTSWHAVRADGRRELTGARNLDTLRARLAPSMLRRLRTEVLQQLPSRCDTWVPVPLTAEQRAAHDELSLPIAQLVATARRRPLTERSFSD